MAESLFPFAYLRDARLAGHATGAVPAWLWQSDGRCILWANATAADLFGAASPAALAALRFDSADTATGTVAREIAQLAEALPANGSPRLAALTVPVGDSARRVRCLCSRLALEDTTPAILAVATETGVPAPPQDERVRWLLAGVDAPVAAFAPTGDLIHATPAAGERMGGLTTLASLGAGLLGAEALAKGHAEGRTPLGTLHLDRIGRDGGMALLTTFPALPAQPAAAMPVEAADQPIAPATEAPPTAAAAEQPADASEATADHPAPAAPVPPTDRLHSLRFVWQLDPDGRFTVASDAFAALIGPSSASALGKKWIDVARELDLDPEEQISRAVDSRETWSGITVSWPVDGADERLVVEMSGLPMFDRERAFLGYRGFGVCRNAERFTARAAGEAAPPDTDTTPGESHAHPEDIAPLRAPPVAEADAPALSPVEHTAFRELARQLSARLKGDQPDAGAADAASDEPAGVPEADDAPAPAASSDDARALLDRLPVGVLVYRINTPIYANRAFLKWSGDASLEAFNESGGLDRLFLESDVAAAQEADTKKLTLTTGAPSGLAESRLFSIPWEGERAHALAIVPIAIEPKTDNAELRRARERARELQSIIDLSTDGIVMIDDEGAVVRLSHGAEALFGCASDAAEGRPFAELLAPECRDVAAADFAALLRDGDASPAGREVVSDAGSVPLFMTLGHVAADKPAYCAVFRDISGWKRSEQSLVAAKRQAEQASQAKSDFLAKISHEIRTPLNAIIGFSEVMMEERLGPVENERYRAYLKDIHASGEHLVALLTDLLDLSKIEAGKLELKFDRVSLNELTRQCVALMQPQANRGRVIIRTSLAPGLPPIVADARSVRQILLNLLSNSIKFTGAGGQVIVSTALTESGDAVLRVRDTGIGMSEKEIETALEPFRQIETSMRGGSGGTGLGLPLTKALAEANRANFAIRSNVNSGTLVEVAFPTARPQER